MFVPDRGMFLLFLLIQFLTVQSAIKKQVVRIIVTEDGFSNEDIDIEIEENIIANTSSAFEKYLPNWESIDSRPIPKWYDDAKVGIFIHWGVFSVPSYKEWFWKNWADGDKESVEFMKANYPPGFTYQDFGQQFTAEFFDPNYWAEVLSSAGAKYIVLTTKHHDGFTLWPSKYSFSWNAMDIGPKRDIVGQLADAIRNKTDLRFGLYHSLYEWYNPLWLSDKASNFTQRTMVTNKVIPELKQIVTTYKPDVVWSDGDWEASDTYWTSTDFLAWLYNDSPVKDTVVTNDRWGIGTMCKHGGFLTCSDHFRPGKLQPRKWENCLTLDKSSWAYRRVARSKDYLTPEELLNELVPTIAFGGNFLINIGPTKAGILPPIMEERLLQMGAWLKINGPAIYSSTPWLANQKDNITQTVYYTANPDKGMIYAILLEWPGEQLKLGSVDFSAVKKIEILGGKSNSIIWEKSNFKGIVVKMPRMETIESKWAWTLAISIKVWL